MTALFALPVGKHPEPLLILEFVKWVHLRISVNRYVKYDTAIGGACKDGGGIFPAMGKNSSFSVA
jgi:hypothetical protein